MSPPGDQDREVRRGKWRFVLAALGGLAAAVTALAGSATTGREAADGSQDDVDPLDITSSSPGRRLSTSTKCRKALEAMMNNDHWIKMNDTYTRWCRIKAENEMARCCGVADFAAGRGEGCGDCAAQCSYKHMIKLCNSNLGGSACIVDRKLFEDAPLRVAETICIPDDCNNGSDKEAFIAWFATLYAGRLNGWHAYWDDAVLTCPSVAMMAAIWTTLVVVIVVLSLPLLYILFVAPKEPGKTLVSQADMQAQADREEAEMIQDLRTTGMGGDDTRGSTMGVTGQSR